MATILFKPVCRRAPKCAASLTSRVGRIKAPFSSSSSGRIVDLRSDTVTRPSEDMIKRASTAIVGDDVMGEDPTVLELESFMADKFGKERGLYVPTGTMANLVALLSHCDKTRAAEIIIGKGSHINLWEGGNASNIGGIHTRQVQEDEHSAQLAESDIIDCGKWPLDRPSCIDDRKAAFFLSEIPRLDSSKYLVIIFD